MTPIAETRIPVQLDRERVMIFNANTMTAYEEKSGKFYWDTMLALFKFYEDNRQKIGEVGLYVKGEPAEKTRPRNALFSQVMRYVSSKDIRAMAWAAIHEYDKDDEPVWPLTVGQIGRLLKPQDTYALVFLLMKGHTENAPSKEELGEASGTPAPTPPADADPKAQGSGGEAGIELPADAFA